MEFDLDILFSYQRLTVEQSLRYAKIRDAARNLAQVILNTTPPGADRSAAVRKVREAVMMAHAGISCCEVTDRETGGDQAHA